MSKKLFQPFTLGDIELKNRVVMAPLTRSRAINNVPNDLMKTYYSNRAGAGLIITEGTSPSPNGLGYPRIPGMFSSEQMDGWKMITDAVHEKDGKIFIQLMHTGRIGHPLNLIDGAEILAPSAIQADGKMHTDQEGEQPHPTPRAMTKQDIEEAINEHVSSAQKAIFNSGFDGVEIHAANGYLLNQFINPDSNQRTDEYGGSIENRVRFVLEVARAMVAEIGADKVGIRVSPYVVMNDLSVYDEITATYKYLASELKKIGLVYIHIVDHESMGAHEVPDSVKQTIRESFGGNIILSGGYNAERAEKDLQADKGELVAFGRAFIANPDLVKRMKTGTELNEPNQDTFYTPGAEGYTDYPTLEEAKG